MASLVRRLLPITSMMSCRPPLDARREPLADDVAQRVGETLADEFFLRLIEQTQDTVDGLAGVDGVQGAQHEVARFGGGHGDFDRLAVAHFADEDDLRRLAQRGAQAVGISVEIRAEFALVERALVVLDGRTRPGLPA